MFFYLISISQNDKVEMKMKCMLVGKMREKSFTENLIMYIEHSKFSTHKENMVLLIFSKVGKK